MKVNLEKHLGIWGATDSGKSTFAKKLFLSSQKRAIYISPKQEFFDSEVQTIPATELTLENFRRKKFAVYAATEDELNEVLFLLQDLVNDFPASIRKRRERIFLLCIDELSSYTRQLYHNEVVKFVRNAYSFNTVVCVIDQDPAAINHTLFKQLSQHVIFRVAKAQHQYLYDNVISYALDSSVKFAFPSENYDFIIVNSEGKISTKRRLKI